MRNGLTSLYREHGVEKELRRSLNYVILGVTFGIVCMTITSGPALTGLARELGAGDFIYGVLMALPVIGGLIQLYASYLLEKTRKRKQIFIFFGVTQRLLWIPVALVPYLIPMSTGLLRIWVVIVLVTLSSMSGAFLNVGFYSWMGDLIPLKIRGRYFSIRSRIYTISALLAGLITARMLDMLPGFPGYTTVFIVAGIFGAIDILCFIRVQDVPMQKTEKHTSMKEFIQKASKDRAFRKLVLFWTVWGFAINLSAPFFNMYALGNLKMSFTEITLTGQIASSIATIFFITRWGVFLDRYGSKPVLYITCVVTAVLPLLWLFASPRHFMPVLFFNLIGGMVWCGTDITNQNMLITNTPEQNRSMYVAIYSIVTTVLGNALAYLAGGIFLDQLQKLSTGLHIFGRSINHYQLLFVITIFMRLAAVLIFLPGIQEERSSSLRMVVVDAKGRLRRLFQM